MYFLNHLVFKAPCWVLYCNNLPQVIEQSLFLFFRTSASSRPRHRAKMCRRLMEVFRVTLVVLLTAVFLWQTYMAFSKYIKGDTTITFKVKPQILGGYTFSSYNIFPFQALYPDKQTFPRCTVLRDGTECVINTKKYFFYTSISFCAFSRTENDDPNDNDLEWTFREEAADMRKHEGFVAGFEHDVLEV